MSKLSLVTNVPFSGKVRFVGPAVLNFKSPNPCISKFLPRIIVLPGLLIPVPPLAPDTIPAIFIAESATIDL